MRILWLMKLVIAIAVLVSGTWKMAMRESEMISVGETGIYVVYTDTPVDEYKK